MFCVWRDFGGFRVGGGLVIFLGVGGKREMGMGSFEGRRMKQGMGKDEKGEMGGKSPPPESGKKERGRACEEESTIPNSTLANAFPSRFVSPRLRARRTLELLDIFEGRSEGEKVTERNVDVVVTEEVREWDYGVYEGLTSKEVSAPLGGDLLVLGDGEMMGGGREKRLGKRWKRGEKGREGREGRAIFMGRGC